MFDEFEFSDSFENEVHNFSATFFNNNVLENSLYRKPNRAIKLLVESTAIPLITYLC
jgi:hypothetical protein